MIFYLLALFICTSMEAQQYQLLRRSLSESAQQPISPAPHAADSDLLALSFHQPSQSQEVEPNAVVFHQEKQQERKQEAHSLQIVAALKEYVYSVHIDDLAADSLKVNLLFKKKVNLPIKIINGQRIDCQRKLIELLEKESFGSFASYYQDAQIPSEDKKFILLGMLWLCTNPQNASMAKCLMDGKILQQAPFHMRLSEIIKICKDSYFINHEIESYIQQYSLEKLQQNDTTFGEFLKAAFQAKLKE